MSGRIVIDGVFFQRDHTSGIARAWREVLKVWRQREIGQRVTLLRRSTLPSDVGGYLVEDIRPLDYAKWREDRAQIQDACSRLSADLFISTYYTHPETTPSLLWVYDMIPERLGFDLSANVWRQKHAAIEYASGYASLSQNTSADMALLYPHTHLKPQEVVSCGVSPEFTPASERDRRNFQHFINVNLQGRPYIFFPGLTTGYKNGRVLLEALERTDCSQLGLLLTVQSEDVEAFRRISGLAVHCEHLNEFGLRMAYSCAHCLVYPSMYEGFGLPVVEAMAAGCPVICSNTSSLPEVAGDATLMFSPTRSDQLMLALGEVSRSEVRGELIQRGLSRAAEFKWDEVASRLEAVIARTLEDCRHRNSVSVSSGDAARTNSRGDPASLKRSFLPTFAYTCAPTLGERELGFRALFEFLEQRGNFPITMVEIDGHIGNADNAVSSTLIFDKFTGFHGGSVLSIDAVANRTIQAKSQYSSRVQTIQSDPVRLLRQLAVKLPGSVDVLYLSACADERGRAFNVMKQVAAALPALKVGAVVCVDTSGDPIDGDLVSAFFAHIDALLLYDGLHKIWRI